MKYVYDVIKDGTLEDTMRLEDLAKKRLFKTYVDGNYNRAFMLGFSFDLLLSKDAINKFLLKDILSLQVSEDLQSMSLELIDEYTDCIDEETINTLDLTNYLLTVMERSDIPKEEMLKITFLLGRAFKDSHND